MNINVYKRMLRRRKEISDSLWRLEELGMADDVSKLSHVVTGELRMIHEAADEIGELFGIEPEKDDQ